MREGADLYGSYGSAKRLSSDAGSGETFGAFAADIETINSRDNFGFSNDLVPHGRIDPSG